jgi:type II secretory pathway pseudopilin PulG
MTFRPFNLQSPTPNLQRGQTLIETLAAVFILTMGISAAVGLAVYALNSSGGIVKQIIATGLAREGLEAVRNMRDTNWLQDTLGTQTNGNNCYVYNNASSSSSCYPNWLGKNGNGGPPFCLNPSPGGSCNGSDSTDTYYLGFNSNPAQNSNLWSLTKDNSNFGLTFNNPAISNTWETNGFYSPSGTSCLSSSSDYCRKIIITKNPSSPPAAYTQDPVNMPLVYVQSQVWWVDKKCPKVPDFSNAPVGCRLELDTYLTNWKNF